MLPYITARLKDRMGPDPEPNADCIQITELIEKPKFEPRIFIRLVLTNLTEDELAQICAIIRK